MQNLHASVCTVSLPQLLGLGCSAPSPVCVCVCPCSVFSPAVCPACSGYPLLVFFSVSFVLLCVVLFALRSSMKIIGPMSFVQQCVKSSLYNQVFLSSFLFLFLSLPLVLRMLAQIVAWLQEYVTVKLCLLLWTMCARVCMHVLVYVCECMCVYTLLLCRLLTACGLPAMKIKLTVAA